MELRKAEQEVDRLKAEWKALRQKCASYDDTAAIDLSVLPSWKTLMSKIVDSDIFPEMPVEEVVEEVVAAVEAEKADVSVKSQGDADRSNVEEEEGGYSEYGMLITGSNAQANEDDKPAAKPEATPAAMAKPIQVEMEVESDDEEVSFVKAPPPEVLSQLQSFMKGVEALKPKIDKFLGRLIEVS